MTYNSLKSIIDHINKQTKIPKAQLRNWKVMIGRRHGNEAPLLIGRLRNGNFASADCELADDIYLEDTLMVNTYNAKCFDNLFAIGSSLGIDREELQRNTIAIKQFP